VGGGIETGGVTLADFERRPQHEEPQPRDSCLAATFWSYLVRCSRQRGELRHDL